MWGGGLSARTHQTPEERIREMCEAPVRPLVLRLSGPSIVANLITAAYNLADAYFVGQISTAASGAIGVAAVAMTIIQAIGFYFGQGTGNALARYLGARERDKACVMANMGLACTFGLGVMVAVLGNAFLEPLCLLSGSTPTILPYAKTYIGIILVGAPWMASSLMLNMHLRFEGEAARSMVAIGVGAVLNTVLTPMFVFTLGMGIAGSALSTILCELLSFSLLLAEMRRADLTPVSVRWLHGCEGLRPGKALFAEINNGGLPSFVRQVMLGAATTLLNGAARPFGDAAIASIAVVQRVTWLGNYVQIGIGQGFQPVLGYNIGARRYDRVREAYFFSLRAAFAAVLAIGIVTCAFAPWLVAFFRDDPEVVRIATPMLRVMSLTLPLAGMSMITNFLLQTSGRMWRATLLGGCRLGLVLGPVVTLLSATLGLTGVQVAQGVTDVITTLVAIPMAVACLREMRAQQTSEGASAPT